MKGLQKGFQNLAGKLAYFILSAVIVISLSSCKNSINEAAALLFGITEDFTAAVDNTCTSDVTITTAAVSIVEDGDVTATFDEAQDNDLNEVDADGGTAWGYRSFETCIYLPTAFTGTVEIPLETNDSYSSRLTSLHSYHSGAVATDSIPSTLTFTADGVAGRHCFSFTRIDDGIRNATEDPLAITLGTIVQKDGSGEELEDGFYHGKNVCDISLSMEDDEGPGIRVSNISQVMEEPGVATPNSGTFSVLLRTEPTSNVTITINDTADPVNAGNREGTASPTTLTFTSGACPATGNWCTAQLVTVTSVDDLEVDGLKTYTVQTENSSSNDSDYNGINPRDVVVYNRDQSIPGYTYERFDTTGGSTTSSGGSITGFATDEANNMGTSYSTFQIKLRSKPSANVTLDFSTTCGSKCNLLTSQLVFTPSNWNTLQTVQVEGAGDGADAGNQDYNVTFIASSSDNTYSSLVTEPSFRVRSCDNDNNNEIQPCNFSGSSFGTSGSRFSGGEPSATSYIWLITKAPPGGDITVPLSSSDTTEGTVPASVTISSGNYNTMTTGTNRVALSHADDTIVDGSKNWTAITGTASGGSSYAGTADIYATTTDNENYFYVNRSGSTQEGTATAATISVCLGANNPDEAITVNIACSGDECGTLSAPSITFPTNSQVSLANASNSGCPNDANKQTFTVQGADDAFADGTQSFSVTLTMVANGDSGYSGASHPSNPSVNNADNEPAGKAIFVTSSSYNGEMTAQGVQGADSTCQTTKPGYAPSGTYKALIVGVGAANTRTASPAADWVLSSGLYYYRCESGSCTDEAAHLFVANGSGLIPFPMSRGFSSTTSHEFWTGMNADMTIASQTSNIGQNPNSDPAVTDNCAGFTYQNDPDTSATFYGQTWTTTAGGAVTSNTNIACTTTKKIICVQQ